MSRKILIAGLLAAALTLAGERAQVPAKPAAPAKQAARTTLDGAAQRNENVHVNRIDNDAIKEANVRLGDHATLISEMPAETGYYATEHGRPAAPGPFLAAPAARSDFHAEFFESHQNSVLNARTFFQVGSVQPSHRNSYGGRFTSSLGKLGMFSGGFGQRAIQGMVNGNILVPLPSERTPLTPDPALRAIVSRFLAAYPAALPNRTDFDPRGLNTNAPQSINETDFDGRLDKDTSAKGRLSASYSVIRQRVDAFQFVAGQNPDNEIHGARSGLTYRHTYSPRTSVVLGFQFNRSKSVLMPESNAVGPRVRIGFQIEELGPDSMFPIDRAQNSFRWGAIASTLRGGGKHALSFGGDLLRYQLNGVESNNQRGYFQFTNAFGRTALENFRWGTPSIYEVSVGELYRGFRNWSANAFFGDKWTISPKVQIYYGLRYNLESAPVEIHGLNPIPYGCDCNNLSPRFSVAWRAGRGWVVRTAYTTSFGQIQPVTYQQIRNNAPLVHYIDLRNPDLLNPLKGINLNDPNVRTSPTVLSPDMVSPYAHQYNFSLERRLGNRYLLRTGYIGSRSFKLLNYYTTNRGWPVPGIPYTTETIDQRRPDPRYYEIKNIVNGGIGYMDAAQITLDMPLARGFMGGLSYTFGKAIDEGPDYASTAANKDLAGGRSQSEFDSAKDKKGLSNFDSTHAFMAYYSYDLPRLVQARNWAGWLTAGWQLSGSALLKMGTPFTLYIGSDAPGIGNVDGGPSERPNILDPSILGMTVGNPDTATKILSRDRFAYIPVGELRGNIGRGTFRKCGIRNFNAALTKQWNWGGRRERAALIRAEAYNLTNTPQFDEPWRNLTSPSFGKITNTLNSGRVMQVGFRIIL
jgi:hypothetical protein